MEKSSRRIPCPQTTGESMALTAFRQALEQKDAMNKLTDTIRTHHRSLAGTLSAHMRGVGGDEHSERRAFVAFLKGDVLPHARSEERHLYPIVGAQRNQARQRAVSPGLDCVSTRSGALGVSAICRPVPLQRAFSRD